MVLRGERTGVEQKFFELCQKVVSEQGLELYDMDFYPGQKELRVYIQDKNTGTAVIENCVDVDKALTPYIDELDWMPDSLRLEVSSPGIFRSLTTVAHFESAKGEYVELHLKKKLDDENVEGLPRSLTGEKKIRALLDEVRDSGISVEAKDFKFDLNFEQIKKASLSPDI